MSRAAIGLGANLGDAHQAIRDAFVHLDVLGSVVARSSLYETPPWGVRDQPPFVNACAILDTVLEPVDLLRALKRIEDEMGRVASYRWGPRAIDLDILTYDSLSLATDDLTLPHPRMRERAFVLVPLAEIDGAYDPLLRALPAADRDAIRIVEE